MEKLCVLFVLALVVNVSLSMSVRHKRQSNGNDADLEDRYGWNRPNLPGRFPSQFPNQFPNQIPNQFPNQFPNQNQQQQQSTTQNPSGTTTMSAAVQQCIRDCGVTSEYSPVCGSDNVTYFNPGRLLCAQNCGVAVNQVRQAPCPVSTPPPELASLG